MKKRMILAGLCAVAVLSLSGCSKDKGLKSVDGYKQCTATNAAGNVCMAFGKNECTSDMIKALAEKEVDLITSKKITKEDKIPNCPNQDETAIEKKLGPDEFKRMQEEIKKAME
jgi:hypothetical protein